MTRCARVRLVSLVLVACGALSPGTADAQLSREEALAGVYPGASVRAERVFLTTAQQRQAATHAGVDVPSALVARYVATTGAEVVGRAYVDTHIVRTKKESVLISLDARGQVKRVDVIAFTEPVEYQASDVWLRQFAGRQLDPDLELNRAIRPVIGATLTARAANAAVRRVLAIDAVLTSGGTP